MTLISSKLTRLIGFVLTIVGIVMVVISGYYLHAYIRSGSDAELFNVVAAAPEDHLVLLGQAMPKPDSHYLDLAAIEEVIPPSKIAGTAEEVVIDASRREVESNRAESVSIMSVLPGTRFAAYDNAVEPQSHNINEDVVEPVAQDMAMLMVTPPHDEAADSSEVLETSVISSEELIGAFASIYPGGNMNPRYWSDPYWAGNLPFGGQTIPEGFIPVDADAYVHSATSAGSGVRMRIPAIELDAAVSELEIRDLGDSREWSTPDKVVGHIPSTAKPGESANGWYFGHLEDFLANEGDIFRRLPEISKMIKNDPVDIFIATSDAEYMYRVTDTRQVHSGDLHLTDTSNAQITLVTCWPFRVYDHRIVVSAVLIAVKPLQKL